MANVVQYAANGEAHGLVDVRTNSVEFNDFKHMDPKIKAIVEKEKKEDARLVDVEYINRKGRHERLTKPYMKYAGDPIQMWNFIPGNKYKVPLGLVKEVNEKKIVRRSGLMSIDGNDVNKDGSPLAQDMSDDWEHKFVKCDF